MVSKYPVLTLIVAALLTNAATAQTLDGKPPVTVSDLDAIMQEEIVLKAMANRAKQRVELGRFDGAAQTTRASTAQLPQLAWRRATASGWLAKFVLSDGGSLIAGTGEQLPGGFLVAQIDDRGVQLKRNGELIDLTAAASGARPLTQPNRAEHGGLPPAAPIPNQLRQ